MEDKTKSKSYKSGGQATIVLQRLDRSTRVGLLISDYLKNEEQLEDHVIHLLFAANRWEFRDTMLNLIKNGTTLIVDRYSFSGVAFSATKSNMDIEWCKQPEVGLPSPDAVIFMELDPHIASVRGQFGDERYEDLSTQQQVQQVYQKLQQANWKVMDADKPIGQLQMELLEIVENIIKSVGESPLSVLWN